MFKRFLGTLALTAMLAACGSGGSDHTPTAGGGSLPGGGSGGPGTPPQEPVYQLGSGTGSSFQPGAIGTGSASLSAGGSTSLSVSVVDQTGALYTEELSVTFSSSCIGQQLATVTSPVVTSSGVATTTYVASGCSGDDVITARTTADGQQIVATTTVTVAEAAIGSIEFVSATPTNVSLRGAGGPGRPETSTVVFRVRNSSNGPRASANVAFTLLSNVGGVTLDPATATSDANGLVQTVVSSGTVATTVSVTATVQDTSPQISTQSSPLTITTGIVDGNSISLSAQCSNVEGWNVDGTIVPVTVRMADRFNNPVPDGTAANFRAEGGAIAGQCTTITTDTESGLCSVNWSSQNPRPSDGRISLLVTATGEESFVDSNGNGIFNDGDASWEDLGEPFVDNNEDGIYQLGEDFLDFGGIPNVRDAPDGEFNGVLCSRTTAPACSATTALAVGDRHVIIMSGSTPDVTQVDGAGNPVAPGVTVPANGAASVRLWIRDENGNPMPGGTSVEAAVTANGVQLAPPASVDVPCSTIPAGAMVPGTTVFTFNLTAGATPAAGFMNITVTTPRGLATTVTIPVSP